ncbi:hypothetical protein EDC04DRAFT_1215908 [Pisolithus marmoratus]|nr:hypothetical protein EDC04DRAFT_1215908 [Pisolithus marmoratus]
MPLLLDAVDEGFQLSKNIARESSAISLTSQAPSCTTHTHDMGVQDRASHESVVVFHLSTGSRASAMDHLPSRNRCRWDGNTNGVDHQLRQSPSLHSATRTLADAHTRLPAGSLFERKRNNTDLPTPRKIRRLPDPSGSWLRLAQRAVWIAPAQCAEMVVASPGDRTRPTNPPPPGEYVPFPCDSQSMITTCEDRATGCCTFFR